MGVERTLEYLKKKYGFNDVGEFLAAYEKFEGFDISIFAAGRYGVKKNEEKNTLQIEVEENH